jgi:hypothetical protein
LVIDKVINKLFHFAGEVTQFHQLVKVEEGNDGVLGITGNVNYLENKKNYQSPWGVYCPSINSIHDKLHNFDSWHIYCTLAVLSNLVGNSWNGK